MITQTRGPTHGEAPARASWPAWRCGSPSTPRNWRSRRRPRSRDTCQHTVALNDRKCLTFANCIFVLLNWFKLIFFLGHLGPKKIWQWFYFVLKCTHSICNQLNIPIFPLTFSPTVFSIMPLDKAVLKGPPVGPVRGVHHLDDRRGEGERSSSESAAAILYSAQVAKDS